MFFKIAWRNIWRNPRRTTVILMAIIIGVWSMIFLGALMRGIEDGMVKNGIKTLTGHIQIHRVGYRNDPVVENSLTDMTIVKSALDRHLPSGAQWSLRVKVSAIVSNARHSSAVTLVGIDPVREAGISFIGNAVTTGRYLNSGDEFGIVIGQALADKFETKLGRKLIIMSQDTGRDIASRAFRIIGVFNAEMKATEEFFVFITQSAAQEMLKLPGGISEVSIVLENDNAVNQVITALKSSLPADDYEVLSWKELLPLLTTYLKMYNEFIAIWYLVVFIAMSFGIVNTTLMAVFERIREFGLLKSLGMKPLYIVKEVLTESFILLLVGAIMGNLLSFGCVYILSGKGIDLTAFAAGTETWGMSRIIFPILYGKDIAMANVIVFVLGVLVSLYPAVKAARFTPVEALAHT